MADRLTMIPLLGALLDYDSDPETYARYDAMTARELFRQYGVSKRLYEVGDFPLRHERLAIAFTQRNLRDSLTVL